MTHLSKRKGPPLTICGTGKFILLSTIFCILICCLDDWMAPEVIMGMDYDERVIYFYFSFLV